MQSGLFGTYNFTGQFTGNPYADFLLGLPSTVLRLDPYSAQYDRYYDLAFFAQDDFKVTRRLTLSYGLRYEYYGPVTANGDNFYSFDLSNGKIVVPSSKSMSLFSPYFPTNIPVETARPEGLGRSLRNGGYQQLRAALRLLLSARLERARPCCAAAMGIYYDPLSANVNSGLVHRAVRHQHHGHQQLRRNGQPLFTLANPFAVAGQQRHAQRQRHQSPAAQCLCAAVQPDAGARDHARYRRARELHRLARPRS